LEPTVPRRPIHAAAAPSQSLAASLALLVAATAVARGGDPAVALRERYLAADGLPSPSAYAAAHGLAPAAESYQWRVVFKLAYRTADLERLADARALHADCYFVRTRRYVAPHRALPVWDGRVVADGGELKVAAFTPRCERVVGQVDPETGLVALADAVPSAGAPDFAGVRYNPFTGQLWRQAPGGEIVDDERLYLPPPLVNARGEALRPALEVVQTEGDRFALMAGVGAARVALATCTLGEAADVRRTEGFAPLLADGASMITTEPTTIVQATGAIAADALEARGAQLVVLKELPAAGPPPAVAIDGRFDEWRSRPGIADPQGDVPSYLQYNPDTDLLELKVASDGQFLYFYTRVAGQHGRTAEGRDRYYYYVYIDADRDARTGYVPTRDDDCYYGVALGDDCEAQFEFVGGRFVKTFFGFTGAGTEKEVLDGRVTLAPSWYARHDERGRLRDRYKVEYVHHRGQRKITEDFTEGTSDDITFALSPDGAECEMRAELAGFLVDPAGQPIIAPGQSIDLAAGVEASGGAHGNTKWGADSTAIIRGYRIE
jgi:hypothetical protein